MGCGPSKTVLTGGGEDSIRDTGENDRLDVELLEEKRRDRVVKKLLLLGPGNSGKSTFFKQLLQIHGNGFTDQHRMDAKRNVYDSILYQVKFLFHQAHSLEYDLPEAAKDIEEYFENLPRDTAIDLEIARKINEFWAMDEIKKAFENRENLSVADSTPYFFEHIDRIAEVDYTPTTEDMILVRTATTGVTESTFVIQRHTFKVFDVGGQRSERSKWINCFDSVTAVLFVASLSCYDQTLFEDDEVNAMEEALTLFEETCNSRWFRKTSMILFLNKKDLFEDKIGIKPLTLCFPEYAGENEFEPAAEYVRGKFNDKNHSKTARQVYSHITCATDAANVEKVFNDVQHVVVNNSLVKGGLL